jgi:hypothetical protein
VSYLPSIFFLHLPHPLVPHLPPGRTYSTLHSPILYKNKMIFLPV